jgi:hypothetical protein
MKIREKRTLSSSIKYNILSPSFTYKVDVEVEHKELYGPYFVGKENKEDDKRCENFVDILWWKIFSSQCRLNV